MPVTPTLEAFFTAPGTNFAKTDPTLNGDAWVCMRHSRGDLLVAVMDGARAPYTYEVDGLPTDTFAALRFAQLLRRAFRLSGPRDTAWDLVARCVEPFGRQCADLMGRLQRLGHWVGETLDPKVWNPAAAFVVVVFHANGGMTLAQGADCTASVIHVNGTAEVLTTDQHEAALARGLTFRLPQRPEDLLKHLSPAAVLEMENAVLRKNRARYYNRRGGMAVFNGEQAMLTDGGMRRLYIPARGMAGITKVVLTSDGLLGARRNTDMPAAALSVATLGPKGHYERVIQPRYAPRPVPGDVTGLVVTL